MTKPVDTASTSTTPTSLSEARAAQNETFTLDHIVEMATATIAGCDYAGVSLCVDRRKRLVETAAASDQIVFAADELQYAEDEGPCLSALWTDGVFLSQDVGADDRWCKWGPRAAELGIGSVLGLRLGTDPAILAALNLYSRDHDGFGETDIDLARMYASYAGTALAAVHKVEMLQSALDTRHVIGMAQGMLIQRFGLSREQAFDVLRQHSMDRNTKLAVVAEELVHDGAWPPVRDVSA